MNNIEIIDMNENDMEITETLPGGVTEGMSHASLIRRNENDQHTINAITGLRQELDDIKGPRTIESDKVGVANYYLWADGNPDGENRVGRFVKCQNHLGQVVISIANSDDDVFGVTVDEAAFIGGQGSQLARDDSYGLVVTSGLVDVRCDGVVVGESVTPGDGGIGTRGTNVRYGNKVIAIKNIEGDQYAKIFLGTSSKEANDMASYMVSNITNHERRLTSAEASIQLFSGEVGNIDELVSTNVNITGGTIGDWDIDNGFESTFGEDDDQRTVTLASDPSLSDDYVLSITKSNNSLVFGLDTDGGITTDYAHIENADIPYAEIDTADINTIIVNNGGTVGKFDINTQIKSTFDTPADAYKFEYQFALGPNSSTDSNILKINRRQYTTNANGQKVYKDADGKTTSTQKYFNILAWNHEASFTNNTVFNTVKDSQAGMVVGFQRRTGFGIDDNNTWGYFRLSAVTTGVTGENGEEIAACSIIPSTNGLQYLGINSNKFKAVYANTFYGDLSGTASKATNADEADYAERAKYSTSTSGAKVAGGLAFTFYNKDGFGVSGYEDYIQVYHGEVGGTTATCLRPSTNNMQSLGSASLRWRNVYGWNIDSYVIKTDEIYASCITDDGINVSIQSDLVHIGGTKNNHSYSYIYLWGTAYVNNGEIQTSDARFKNSISEMDDRYDKLFDLLSSKIFKYNDGASGRYHSGFIAQEVQQSIKDAGLTEKEFAALCTRNPGTDSEQMGIRYSEFVSINTWQIQKLKARVKELEDKIALLSNN